jgi:LysM repeat protein
VITELHPMGELLMTHRLQPKQTLFSLARFYGLNLQELYAYNPHISTHYEVGDLLHIPLPLRAVIRKTPPPVLASQLAKVYYRVKRGDTLYGLCNRTFHLAQDTLYWRNPNLADGLRPGELLFIGWMPTTGIPEAWRSIRGGPYARMNYPLRLEYFRALGDRQAREERGAATWPQNVDESAGFFCLHRTAPLNSIVEVHNPLTRQTMYLKVSGRLPEGIYDRNTLIVVSPLAAKALGALDNRFYVRIKYQP